VLSHPFFAEHRLGPFPEDVKGASHKWESVTSFWVVAGIDRATILSIDQSAVSNETKYRRLSLSCCHKLLTISQLPSSFL